MVSMGTHIHILGVIYRLAVALPQKCLATTENPFTPNLLKKVKKGVDGFFLHA